MFFGSVTGGFQTMPGASVGCLTALVVYAILFGVIGGFLVAMFWAVASVM